MLGRNLIESVKQRKDFIFIHPPLCALSGHAIPIPGVQLVYEPLSKRTAFDGPTGKVKDHRDGMALV